MTCSAVLIHYKARDGRTDCGIAVAYTCYIIGIGLLSRVKASNATNLKKPSGTLGGCLRLPVYGRLSLVFFVSLSATLRENGWTDLHENIREGVEWRRDDLIKFRVNSGKWVSGSKVNLLSPDIAIWFDCYLSSSDWECNEIAVLGLFYITTRERGLLCFAAQLVDI